jgi:uncharacterized membrane protein YebE (DUF533 family)
MNAQGMLEQLLKSGLSMIEAKPNAPGVPAGGDAGWGKFGAGAAALGVLAYKAYENWQAQSQLQLPEGLKLELERQALAA